MSLQINSPCAFQGDKTHPGRGGSWKWCCSGAAGWLCRISVAIRDGTSLLQTHSVYSFLPQTKPKALGQKSYLMIFYFSPCLGAAGCEGVFPPEFWKELFDSSFEIPELWTASPGRSNTPHPCSCVPGNPVGYWHWRAT